LDRFDREVLESGGICVVEEFPAETRHNGVRTLSFKKIAIRHSDASEYVLTITEDVTEQQRQMRALEEANSKAEAANMAKSAFLSNMSHEIRTPLNGVVGIADVLATSPLAHDQCEMVEAIRSSGRVLERLLGDILDSARIEAGRLEIRPEPACLAAIVRAAASLAAPLASLKGLQFETEIPDDANAWVKVDEVRISQILNNLLSNAIKFTERGRVTLAVHRAEGASNDWIVTVSDTGIGFDSAQRDLIFGRFEQADGSITRKFGGTGLGLSISRQLAEMMGGVLDCDSTPGSGSTFVLKLPLQACDPPAVQPVTGTEPAMMSDVPLRVLLADDHAVNRKVVSLILAQIGVQLTEVEDGDQAIEAFAAGQYDLVLMDMQMPRVDGLTATRKIRTIEQRRGGGRTPVFMLTANAMNEHARASLHAGADMHLAKPITSQALLNAIDAQFSPNTWDTASVA
jgi:signal transduction histidine kinase/ActR/RegA family two-component response regulator